MMCDFECDIILMVCYFGMVFVFWDVFGVGCFFFKKVIEECKSCGEGI